MKKITVSVLAALLLCFSICLPRPVCAQIPVLVTVGPGGSYPSLTGPGGFFETLNSNIIGLIGNTELRITGNLCEPGTHMLNGSKLNSHNLKIIPNPGAPLPIIINNCTDISQSMIRLDGVANMTISGLTLVNTNTTPANAKPVLEFINFSTNVILENNFIRSNNPSTIEGTIMLGGAVHTDAIIRNNIIGDAVGGGIVNFPGNGIYANNATDRLQITNNTISNNTNYAIYLNTGNGTVVDGNRIFQSVPKNNTGGGIYLTGGGNLTVTNNTIGNNDAAGGGAWVQNGGDFTGIYAVPNTFAPDPLLNTTISGNTIEDINFNTPGTSSFSGIFCQQGNITLPNNIIRNNTINSNSFIHAFLLNPVNGSSYILTGNAISNMINNNTGSTSRLVGIRNQGSGGLVNITNNSFTNFQTYSTNTSSTAPCLVGIEIASSSGQTDLFSNEFKGWGDYSSGQSTLTGINANSFPNTINIIGNKFSDFRNSGLAGSNIFGLNIQGGNSQVNNNFIGITNNGNTNDVSITGLNFSGNSSSANNAFYNSIYIGNTITAGSSSTFCIRRTGSAVINFMNNALVNNAQGGTGNHLAIANTRSSSTALGFNASNYNYLFSRNASKLGIWNSTLQDFTNWITVSQKDGNSLTASPPSFDPQILYNPSTGEFVNVPGATENWYLYGNAHPIAGITTDQRGIPGTRPDIISNGTPDIGAYEMDPPTVNPPNLLITGVTAPGATQDFFFGGQRFGSIQWGLGGTIPMLNFVKRFSQPLPGFNGANPGLKSISNYFEINATGGSGFTARTTFFWFPNADGRIIPISNAVIGKRESAGTWSIPPGSVYVSSGSPFFIESLTVDVGQFSLFTAVDPASTLPVNLLSFKAQKKNNDILLLWLTAGETEHDHFEVERSVDGVKFISLAMVTGNNNTSSEKNYTCTDASALLIASGKLYYRLKLVSLSGNSTYSNIIQIPLSAMQQKWSWKISPNPFLDRIAVNLYLPENSSLEFSLYNMTGALLRKKMVRGEKGYSTVEMTGLSSLLSGSYFLQLRNNGQVISEKLVRAGHQ